MNEALPTVIEQITITETGSPEVLAIHDQPLPEITANEVLVEVHAAGVNYIDVYHRNGNYPVPLPYVPGLEGSGVVRALGESVTDFQIGDRVVWANHAGSYRAFHAVPAEKLITLPDGIDFLTGAAMMLQGLTAHFLATSSYPIQRDDWVLIHAGAGGVGQLLTQLAAARGAKVITTVSTDSKEQLSRKCGASEVIRYERMEDISIELPEAVKELTAGAGVKVAYDSVGKQTYLGSLNSLQMHGHLVLFGASSGPVPAIDPQLLNQAGSVYLSRPSLFHYVATREQLVSRANELFNWVLRGTLRINIGAQFPLEDASIAHEALEARATAGKILLIP